jgi:hypothetical protein
MRAADTGTPQNADGSGPSVTKGLYEWSTDKPTDPFRYIAWYKIATDDSPAPHLKELTCADQSAAANQILGQDTFIDCPKPGKVVKRNFQNPLVPNPAQPLVSTDDLFIAIYDPDGYLIKNGVYSMSLGISSQPAPPPPGVRSLQAAGLLGPPPPCNGATLTPTSGTPQTALKLAPFAPLQVKVTIGGAPVSGCAVDFTIQAVPPRDGSQRATFADGTSQLRTITKEDGTAQVANIKVPYGRYTVSATISSSKQPNLVSFDLVSAPGVYFLGWPLALQGDTNVTPAVTLYYLPKPKAATRDENTAQSMDDSLKNEAEDEKAKARQKGLPQPDPDPPVPPGGGSAPPQGPGSIPNAGAEMSGANNDDCKCALEFATALGKALSQSSKAPPAPTSVVMKVGPYKNVHKVYPFNITTGMIYSTLRNPTWSRVETAPPSGCTSASTSSCSSPELYTTVENPAPRPIEPALFLTAYVFGSSDVPRKWHLFGPFDPERKWHFFDLMPQPSVGLSLTSPSTDFFAGGSSEVHRSVQIVYGVHRGKVNYLAPTLANDPTSSAAPVTLTHFRTGYYVGITFNIPFISSVFGK